MVARVVTVAFDGVEARRVDVEVQLVGSDGPTVFNIVGLPDTARRTGLSGARPLSLGNVRGQLHEMLKARGEVYAQVADLTVNTDGRIVDSVAEQIIVWEAQRDNN